MAKSLCEAQTTGANAQQRVALLQFELDEMDIKYGELQKEHDKVQNRAEDMAKELEKAREVGRTWDGLERAGAFISPLFRKSEKASAKLFSTKQKRASCGAE